MENFKIKYILEGLWNTIRKPFLHKEKLKLYNKRYNICKQCEHNNHSLINRCKLCGCFIRSKTMVDYPLDDDDLSIGGCPHEETKW